MRTLAIVAVVVLSLSSQAAAQCDAGARFVGGRCRTAHELAVAGLPPLDEPAAPYYRADVGLSVLGGVLAFGGWTLGAVMGVLTAPNLAVQGFAFMPLFHGLAAVPGAGDGQAIVHIDGFVPLAFALVAAVLEIGGVVIATYARYRPPHGPTVALDGGGLGVAF